MTVTEAASTKKKDKSNLTTVKRMLSAYKKRKREEKIGKLSNDSSHWSGLENNELE